MFPSFCRGQTPEKMGDRSKVLLTPEAQATPQQCTEGKEENEGNPSCSLTFFHGPCNKQDLAARRQRCTWWASLHLVPLLAGCFQMSGAGQRACRSLVSPVLTQCPKSVKSVGFLLLTGPGRRGNKVRTVLQSYKVWKEREEWGKVGKALQNPPTQCPGEGSRAGCPAEGDTPVGSRAPGMCPPLPTSASLEGALGSSLSLSLQFPGTKRKYLQPSALSIYVFAKPLSPPGL